METLTDSRFDPNFAAQLLLDIAHEQSLERLLQKVVHCIAASPDAACAQIWLIAPGDLCAACPQRPECPDQSRCLHLFAGDGLPLADSGPGFDDLSARLPLGLGPVGKVATDRESLLLAFEKTPGTVIGFDWLKRAQVGGLAASPIMFKGDVLGVFLVFTRDPSPDPGRSWTRIFADHIGAAIANARAFEEIQRLKKQLELQNTYLQEEIVEAKAFGDLVGQSSALQQIISQIDLVAPTEASVLILGETGTGKELVAHEVHRRSRRKDNPLIRVNCASIPKELFESELFGHVKGAYTGALKDRSGRFETAEGGTIFLDEIGEIPLEMQSKLLRVLQEKRYERVGEDRTRHADVRIISATNRDLKQAVAERRFREDLYYRLNVFPIEVVPLRARKDDIPLLANHFLGLCVKELRCPKPRLTRADAIRLQAYAWPGNVRELRNVIERAVILARGGPLHFDLPTADSMHTPLPSASTNSSDNGAEYFTETEMCRKERDNLLVILQKTGWKIKGVDGAAELLGVKPTTLLSRIKQMGLERPAH